MTTRIAIIGANGQVGSEVCLFLRSYEDIEVIPICRTEIGSAFLRRCGFTPRLGSVSRPAEARALLSDCDLVADFSLPSGSSAEVRDAMRGLILTATEHAPAGVPFVYLSSITAFGIPDFRGPLKHYRLSRNQYGASKRYAERLVRKACKRTGRKAFVLRVGVVHGELQAVSRQTLEGVRRTAGLTTHVPDAPSFTVFAFSIAEALAVIARGREEPGTYTMLSNPSWSWKDIQEYYLERAGLSTPIVLLPPHPAEKSSMKQMVACTAWRLLSGQKDVIGSYLATRFPALEQRIRARYHRKVTANELASGGRQGQHRPHGNNHSDFPGKRLQSLSDSRTTMEAPAREVRAFLAEVQERALEQTLS